MRKKLFWSILAAVLLAALFLPIPKGPCKDGGTREYTALTYKLVSWNRLTDDGIYSATKVYPFPQNFKPLDELWSEEEQNVIHKFVATVLELSGNTVLVRPVEGEHELTACDKISFSKADLADIGAEVGSDVEVSYCGGIMESYPAQVHATSWTIAKDRRHRAYTGQWLNRETAEEIDYFGHLRITEIYANCFFAVPVIPMPYTVKFNGVISEEWCVGDQVICTYKNAWYDREQARAEADLLTVEPSDWEPEPGVAYKPVIYLYPEQETQVTVELALDGRLTCTYPAYNGGWQVTAAPDGTLTDADGQTYSYLYWEGETNAQWDMTEGFCVQGEDTAAFLEEALAKLGLTRREANEFIVYWLPLMESNPYNIISFQTDAYTDVAQLKVSPTPDTVIRVFMVWQPTETFQDIPAQELTAPERTGFTVIEWGGATSE